MRILPLKVLATKYSHGKRDSIHHHLLDIISETATVLELTQKPPYTTPSESRCRPDNDANDSNNTTTATNNSSNNHTTTTTNNNNNTAAAAGCGGGGIVDSIIISIIVIIIIIIIIIIRSSSRIHK